MTLTRDQILKADDIALKEIDIPEWGGSIHIRQLNRGEQDAHMKRQFGKPSMKQKDGKQEIDSTMQIFGHDAWLVAHGACDEDGKRIFTNKDVAELEKKSGEVVGRIAKEILEHSGMAKDIEELEELEEDDLKN